MVEMLKIKNNGEKEKKDPGYDKIKIFERIKKEFGYDTTTNIDFLKILGDYLREFGVVNNDDDIGFNVKFINKYTNKLENDKIIEAQRKLEEERQKQRKLLEEEERQLKLEEEERQRKLGEVEKKCPAYTYKFGSELNDVLSILNMNNKDFKKLKIQLHTDKNECKKIATLKIQFLNLLRDNNRIPMFEDNVNLNDHAHEKTIESVLNEIKIRNNYDNYNTIYKAKWEEYTTLLTKAKEEYTSTIKI